MDGLTAKRAGYAPNLPSILSRITSALGISLVATALTACQKSATEPVTLNYPHGWESRPDELAKMMALSQQFTSETGIRVKNIPNAETTFDSLELSRELLREDSPGADLIAIDVIWSPMLKTDLIDLRPYFTDEIALIEPRLIPGFTEGNKVVALPYTVQVGALEYRTDLLRKYGYDHPPKTWDDLERMAARIQAGERANGKKDFWGYVWQGGTDEALTCNALEWAVSEGGGRIIENDRTISVNNPATIRAWGRAKRWIGWISPPSVIAFRERDSMNVFDAGGAAFDRVWLGTTVGRNGRSRQIHWRTSLAAVKTGYTRMPRGPAGSAGTLGGSGLAVSTHSIHRQEAIQLVRFLIRDQLQSTEESVKLSANLPDQPQFYDLPSISDHFDGSDQHGAGVVSRPSGLAGALYEQVTRAHIAAVHSVLTGQKTAPEAAAELEKQLVEITGFRIGHPEITD